jgi:hypothetical protein
VGLDEAAGGETPLEGGVLAGVDAEPERSDAAAEPTGLATVTSADDADTGADRVGSVEAPQTLWRFGAHGDGKRSWRPIAAVAVVGLLAVAFVAPLPAILVWPTWTQDEGTLLVLPSMILKGATPNHTFLSIYGPANLYAIAAAFFIAGQSVLVERIVAVLYHLVLVSSLAALAWRRRGMFAGLTAGAVTIVVGVSYPMMVFAWVGAIAFLALGLYLIDLGLGGRSRRPLSKASSKLGRCSIAAQASAAPFAACPSGEAREEIRSEGGREEGSLGALVAVLLCSAGFPRLWLLGRGNQPCRAVVAEAEVQHP